MTMLRRMYSEGVTSLILTPHYRKGMFETDRDLVQKRFEQLQQKAQEALPGISLFLGCEFHYNVDMIASLEEDPRYRINAGQYVLTEFSGNSSERTIIKSCYSLRDAGYLPVVAHFERYNVLHSKPALLEELHEIGCYLQVNADSLLGMDGWEMKRYCRKMLRKGLIDFIGSDAHNTGSRKSHLAECAALIARKEGQATADQLFVHNPEMAAASQII